jgi:prephenate dehydrogenase
MSHERSIAILGPGLLGGSLALAIRRVMPQCEIRIWGRREEAVADVKLRGIADFASSDAREVAHGASLVILATPILVMEQISIGLTGRLAPDAVVTDVGSVKQPVVRLLEPLFSSAQRHFIGSHPMAGSERAGIEAARANLFQGAACIVTPTDQTDPAALQRVLTFWSTLGCHTHTMSPAEHDRKIARISHLPHAVAAAVTLAALSDDPSAASCTGNGFRDSTRIAGGDPELWTGILLENRTEVMAALEDAASRTKELLEIVRRQDHEELRRFLAEAQQLRARVPSVAPNYGND